jgi:hypothetical protein
MFCCHIARALGEENKANMARPAANGCVNGFGSGEAADFGEDGQGWISTIGVAAAVSNHSVASIARAAMFGSSAWVIGRPTTRMEAPRSSACRGVTTRF